MRRPGPIIGSTILAIIAVVGGIWAYGRLSEPPPGTEEAGSALIGGPFALTNQDGARVTDRDFRGRFMLVDFGYTHCPDVCPMGLQTMTDALAAMPADVAAKVQPVFVTVDPARDTAPVIKDYLSHFDPRFVGLTGSEDEVRDAVKAYRVYAARQGDGADYEMAHTAFIYLMGPDGRYVTHFAPDAEPEAMAKRVVEAVGESAATS